MRIVELDTIGKPASLNKMAALVTTYAIAILDVDDIWVPRKLATQIPFLGVYDVIGTYCQYFGNSHDFPSIPFGNISDYDFFQVNPVINSSALLKAYLMNYDETEITGLEDYGLWIRLRYKEKCKFYNVEDVLLAHRIHGESAFNNTNQNTLPEFLDRQRKLYA